MKPDSVTFEIDCEDNESSLDFRSRLWLKKKMELITQVNGENILVMINQTKKEDAE